MRRPISPAVTAFGTYSVRSGRTQRRTTVATRTRKVSAAIAWATRPSVNSVTSACSDQAAAATKGQSPSGPGRRRRASGGLLAPTGPLLGGSRRVVLGERDQVTFGP